MAFLILGILLLTLKLAELGPVAGWAWWVVLLPFGLTVLWWAVSDKLGLTQRRAMNQMERKKSDRRLRNLEALGLGPRRERRPRPAADFTSSDMHRRVAKDPTHAD
jgi:small Trp-rich protein